jgi:hypothetical protein
VFAGHADDLHTQGDLRVRLVLEVVHLAHEGCYACGRMALGHPLRRSSPTD